MIGAGKRDRRIVFERASTTRDEYNEEADDWSAIGSAKARVSFGTGAERRNAAAEHGEQALTLRVLSTATTRSVTLKDRAVLDGEALDLVGIAPLGRREIEFTAVRSE